jgi:peptide/nickel transport system ATP-binding protein/oligopeptide transport system ATP-binding protein
MDVPVRGQVLPRTVGVRRVLDGVSLDLRSGEALGLLDDSDVTATAVVGRCILRLCEPTSGSVRFGGEEVTEASGRRMRALRRDMQFVSREPAIALNPRWSVARTLSEPFEIQRDGEDVPLKVDRLLATVGIDPGARGRKPREFTLEQRQRINIARALALRPRLLVLEDPVRSLDPDARARVIDLLTALRGQLGVAYLVLGGESDTVRELSDRVALMSLGKIVSVGTRDQMFGSGPAGS